MNLAIENRQALSQSEREVGVAAVGSGGLIIRRGPQRDRFAADGIQRGVGKIGECRFAERKSAGTADVVAEDVATLGTAKRRHAAGRALTGPPRCVCGLGGPIPA